MALMGRETTQAVGVVDWMHPLAVHDRQKPSPQTSDTLHLCCGSPALAATKSQMPGLNPQLESCAAIRNSELPIKPVLWPALTHST
jgi:hypothetical protein